MTDNQEKLPMYYRIDRLQAVKVAILASLVGLAIPLLTELISRWVIVPIFCQDPNNVSICTSGGMIAYYIAAVLITIVAVALLVNLDVYRPIVIALGSMLALWGLKGFLTPIFNTNFVEYLVLSVVLYLICYLVFYWFMQLRNLSLAMFFAVAVTMLVRWVLLI